MDSVRERSNGGGNVCPLRYRVALIAVRECSTCLSTHSGPVDKSVDRLPLPLLSLSPSLDVGENGEIIMRVKIEKLIKNVPDGRWKMEFSVVLVEISLERKKELIRISEMKW